MINNKLYSSLLFIIVYSCLLTISCCKPDNICSDAKNTVVNLSENELSKVPYNGFDTLYFLDQNGDTNIVRGTGKQFYYDTKYETVPPECPSNQTAQKQAYKIDFVPIKGSLNFCLMQQKTPAWISVTIKDYPINFVGETGIVAIKDPFNQYYADSMQINSHTYYIVHRFTPFLKPNTASVNNSYFLYYNVPQGVLLIRDEEHNEEYTILKK